MPEGQQQSIDVSKLPNEALEMLYKQVNVEIETLSRTVPLIQGAITERQSSLEAVKSFEKAEKGVTSLIPITESTFVHGKIEDSDKLLVKLGGNYVVELATPDALAFIENRMNIRRAELNKIKSAINMHQQTKSQIEDEIQRRNTAAKAAAKAEAS